MLIRILRDQQQVGEFYFPVVIEITGRLRVDFGAVSRPASRLLSAVKARQDGHTIVIDLPWFVRE
jgi:hypothetical protein